jgi:hypothetical protein
MDDNLEGFDDIYFEGGDHGTLVRLKGREFHRLKLESVRTFLGAWLIAITLSPLPFCDVQKQE